MSTPPLPSATFFGRVNQWTPLRILYYVAAIIATAIVAKILTSLFVPPLPSPLHAPLMAARNLLLPIGMLMLYVALVRFLEHRSASEVHIRKSFAPFLAGMLVGASLMGMFYLILWTLGMAAFSTGTGFTGLTAAVLYHLATAMGEELLFRAVLFRIVEEIGGTAAAIAISAAIFGLLHVGNDGATAFAIGALTLELGVMLALAYVLTRNIWLAVGIHMSWNFTQGYVFGAEVSGVTQPNSLLQTAVSGPDLLTGGLFGPEASILSLGISVIASTALIVLILRKGGWQPVGFRLRAQPRSA